MSWSVKRLCREVVSSERAVSRGAVRLRGLALALVVLIAFVPRPVAADADAAVRVAVTTKPIHSLVAQVMEGVAVPLLIVDGANSAHTFALKPSVARAIAGSALFIRVSETMEPFTRKLVEGLPPEVTVLTLADEQLGITLLPQRTSGDFEAHVHAGEAGHAGEEEGHADHGHEEHAAARGATDGHLWLDTQNARAITAAAAKALAVRWPQYAAQFAANAAKTDGALATLEGEIAAQIVPLKGKPFIVFHDAYQYFEHRFGIEAAGAVTLGPDQPPSAKRLTQVRQKLQALRAACVFAEPQFQPKLLAAVAEGAQVRTGTLDPEGQALSAGPELYAQLMRALARDLKACLSSS